MKKMLKRASLMGAAAVLLLLAAIIARGEGEKLLKEIKRLQKQL